MQTEYRPHRKEKKDGLIKRAGAGLTSLAGITAAIATITTSTAAVLGVAVHSKNTQLQQAQAQVSSQAQQIQHQAKQIQQLQQTPATPTVTPSPTTGGPPITTDASHYLSNKTATVDNAVLDTGQVVISAHPYVNSIAFYCNGQQSGQPDEAFDVAGSSTFTAVLGIPDDTQNATGLIATITFSNESGQRIGQQFQVSLGHPADVTLDIKGVTQLGMTCDGRNRQTSETANGFDVAFGDAAVS